MWETLDFMDLHLLTTEKIIKLLLQLENNKKSIHIAGITK
jgi:hypothetical protein